MYPRIKIIIKKAVSSDELVMFVHHRNKNGVGIYFLPGKRAEAIQGRMKALGSENTVDFFNNEVTAVYTIQKAKGEK